MSFGSFSVESGNIFTCWRALRALNRQYLKFRLCCAPACCLTNTHGKDDMTQKFSKLMVWHTWKSCSRVSFGDHQVWPTKARLNRPPQVWHACRYLFFTFLGGCGTVGSKSGVSTVTSYSQNNGGTSIFCLKTWLWTFKLFCPHLMLYINEYVSLSGTRMLWRFGRMPELVLSKVIGGVFFIGQREYWLIFWHQYQCVLHISTRNKILWSHRIDFCRILPAICCGKFHISSFVHLWTPLACCQSQHQQHWMFPLLLILRPSVLFPSIILCSLWWWVVICVCLSVDLLSQSTINTRWVFDGD